jgi:hypothetical protein
MRWCNLRIHLVITHIWQDAHNFIYRGERKVCRESAFTSLRGLNVLCGEMWQSPEYMQTKNARLPSRFSADNTVLSQGFSTTLCFQAQAMASARLATWSL